ncbi:MAG TPA: hypothetical protein VD973_14015 [Symbiobacteriaceae bacterium]|nr:hypothetical protein [Symbiobacteriaceae bacterium]
MARRYLPVLLAARMEFHLNTLEDALVLRNDEGIHAGAQELSSHWNRFGYVARETHADLCDQIGHHLAGLQEALTGSDRSHLSSQVHTLGTMLKQLAT